MHCPTCDSPLPVGAMFCGVCGRAVTSADVAAAAARRDEEPTSGTDTQAEPPAWQLRQPPRPTTPSDAPWWVRDRRVEQDRVDESAVERRPVEQRPGDDPTEEEPPAWVVPDRSADASVPEGIVHDPEAAARARQDHDHHEADASRPLPAVETESPPRAVATGPTGAPAPAAPTPAADSPASSPAAAAAAAAPAPAAPAPLRAPVARPDNGPRPTSAPLWTASFAPRPADDEAPAQRDEVPAEVRAADAGDARETAGATVDDPVEAGEVADRPEDVRTDVPPATVERGAAAHGAESSAEAPAGSTPRQDETRTRLTDDAPEAGDESDDESASAPEPASAPTVAGPGRSSAPEPAPPVPLRAPAPDGVVGDTAPVTPVSRVVPGVSSAVTPVPDGDPVPLVEPGQQKVVEHCTHCGALLDEDDIFCPECGAVVQSVALSFTGPVAPLPPEWRPDAPTVRSAPAAETEREPEPEPEREPDPERGPGPIVEEGAGWARPRDERSAEPQAEPPVRSDAVPGRPTAAAGDEPATALPDLPPMPTAAAPASALSGLLDDARSRLVTDDDVDETRLVRRGPAGTEYLFQFSTGESVTVEGSGLLGRAPSPQPGERFDHLVRIADPGKSVSKTHLEFGQELGALWVSDRWSGNGTVVRPREQPARRVEPGTRVRVARGTRVEIGEQFFIVS